MTPVITALVGLLGVLVGALLSSLLQRRNWQLQEAAKAYARLFVVGDEAMRLMNSLAIAIDKLAAEVEPPATVRSRSKEDPQIKREYEYVCEMRMGFRGTENRELRHLMKHAWMLERDSEIRTLIRNAESQYAHDALTLEMQFGKLKDKRQDVTDEQVRKRAPVNRWFDTMDELRNRVAAKYFHGERADTQSDEGPGSNT